MSNFKEILLQYWGYSSFRSLQEDIIKSVYDGKDTLGLLPTGGGKSITFQVPALAKDGVCIVVTPLIALMKDQVENLKEKNIKAVAVYSGMTKHEIDIALDNCIYGKNKFLYVSPERLGTEIFVTRIQDMNVNLLAIDESHCISQWGYDFRPSYLKIAEVRQYIPNVPVLALTATATPEVVDDIQDKLLFKEKNLFQKSFERKNLVYIVRKIDDKNNYLLKRIKKIKGTGIVYVRNRKATRDFAIFLRKNDVSADYYHAGLEPKIRDTKQLEWKSGKTRIIVSTNAFGMGIDKPDVRFVAHIDLPDSIEAYFQEAGRGGRDEKIAYAVLVYNEADILKLRENLQKTYPEIKFIKTVYNSLGNYFQIPVGTGKEQVFDFDIVDFSKRYSFDIMSVYSSLKFLQKEGYIETTGVIDNPSKAHIIIDRNKLYEFQIKNKKFDGFIKLLLRSYEGLFNDFIKINESFIARTADIKEDIVVQYLKKLDEYNVLRYVQKRKAALIVYTEQRLDEKGLIISKENYHKRKKISTEKTESVISYVTGISKCRSKTLLEYFGDKNAYRCGNCDVCMRRNELELSRYEFDLILEKLKEKIREEPIFLIQLVDYIEYKEEKTIKVLQWLLDNNKVFNNKENKLEWKS